MNIYLHRAFEELSEKAMNAQKNGNFVLLAQTHKEMADILHDEGNFADEIKSRVLAFYLDLSGLSSQVYVDAVNTEAVALATGSSGIGERKLSEIYFSTIREDVTPKHTMTVIGSYRLLKMCLKKQWKKVNRFVKKLRETAESVDE